MVRRGSLGASWLLLVLAGSAWGDSPAPRWNDAAAAADEPRRRCTAKRWLDGGCAVESGGDRWAIDPAAESGSEISWPIADDRPYWRRNLFRRFLEDQKLLATEWWPAQSRRWAFSAPLVLAVAGAAGSTDRRSGFDLRWQRSIEGWTSGGRRDVAEGLTRLGDTETAVVLLGGTYLVSRWAGKERAERAASLSAEALLSTALYSSLLKRLTRRTRPAAGGEGAFFVPRPEGGQEATSFPSGHAMGAFAVAAVVSSEFRDKRWVPWVAYGTAGLVALSRVGLGRHFPSDVLAGAVLGQSIGRMVSQRGGSRDEARRRGRIEPLFAPEDGGLGIAYRRSW